MQVFFSILVIILPHDEILCYDTDIDDGLVEFERELMSGGTTSHRVIELIHAIMREEIMKLPNRFITLD